MISFSKFSTKKDRKLPFIIKTILVHDNRYVLKKEGITLFRIDPPTNPLITQATNEKMCVGDIK